jgi:hypothetical protein
MEKYLEKGNTLKNYRQLIVAIFPFSLAVISIIRAV